MRHYDFRPGDTPLLVSVPHAGTELPAGMAARLAPAATDLPDTDWFVDELWDFVSGLGAGLIAARWSRYVVDLNRAPDDAALYTSRTTSLVPMETFDGDALYAGDPPDAREVAERVQRYWRPYHETLEGELSRLVAQHGHAVLLDAHSIRSEVPALFDGVLPHFNLGTNAGASADPFLAEQALGVLSAAPGYETVRDARFKGGYITRHHGRPSEGRHALQLEMAQRCYMGESPPIRDAGRRATVTPVLRKFAGALMDWSPR